MTDKEEILFWKKAIQIINKGYGKPCSEFDMNCVTCQSGVVASWIKKHIGLLEWGTDIKKKKSL